MNSSVSFNSNREKTAPRKLNFQKDIIMPHIYANENFELIKNNSYPVRHERKVITAKKARVRSIVEAIVSKKQIEVSKKAPIYKHRLSKPVYSAKRKTMPLLSTFQPQNFTMDIDEKLNQKAMYYEQQSAAAKQKMKEVMEKVNRKNQSQMTENENQSVNFYITQLAPAPKHIPVSIQQILFSVQKPSKQAKGFVEQQEEKQAQWKLKNRKQINTKTQMVTKPRPKTAGQVPQSKSESKTIISRHESGIFRSKSLMNTRLSRIGVGTEVVENLKVSQRNSGQKQRIKNLFDMIEQNCLTSTLSKGQLVTQMNKLGMLWKSQKQFLESNHTVTVLELSQDSFKLLKSIRKQQNQMKKLDENIFKPQQTPKNDKNNFQEQVKEKYQKRKP